MVQVVIKYPNGHLKPGVVTVSRWQQPLSTRRHNTFGHQLRDRAILRLPRVSRANLQGQAPALYETEVQQAQANHAIKQMVTITKHGSSACCPRTAKGRAHEKFLLGLQDGSTVLVAHSIDSALYASAAWRYCHYSRRVHLERQGWRPSTGPTTLTVPGMKAVGIDFNGQRYQ